jgi:hypothetical protein
MGCSSPRNYARQFSKNEFLDHTRSAGLFAVTDPAHRCFSPHGELRALSIRTARINPNHIVTFEVLMGCG